MKKNSPLLAAILLLTFQLQAQVEPGAGNWKTWLISSGKAWRLPPPASNNKEAEQVISMQKNLSGDMHDSAWQEMLYWNAGAPGYRWQEMIGKLWMYDTSYSGVVAYMLLGVATYDATIAAWDTKYAYHRARPFAADHRVQAFAPKLESPSYPCEYSVAAGVAVAVISHFYPNLADSVKHMAEKLMHARIAAGMAYPSDTHAGFELGKKIAEAEIEKTKDFANQTTWDGKRPAQPGIWNGSQPMFPLASRNRTMILDSSSQFRPAAPPDFAKDMKELKNFKQTFRSQSNAFYWASQDFWGEALTKKIFEYNLHLNAPRAARIYAIAAVTTHDCFIACFDAKYAYWGIRPDQYDTTYHSLIPTPPFPGYPSGHAMMSGMYSELYTYFFPLESAYFRKKAKDAAESRFQAGIHFRTDNETGLDLGRKVAAWVISKVSHDEEIWRMAESKAQGTRSDDR
jgi:hypothetical protein